MADESSDDFWRGTTWRASRIKGWPFFGFIWIKFGWNGEDWYSMRVFTIGKWGIGLHSPAKKEKT